MCFQVNFKPSLRCIERELESSAKTKASTPLHNSILCRHSEQLSDFGIIFIHMSFTKWGESSLNRALMIPFLAIHARGGESISPKQKDSTTTNLKILVFQIWFKEVFSNWYTLFKINFFKLVSYCV
jgi:hypothetical protein